MPNKIKDFFSCAFINHIKPKNKPYAIKIMNALYTNSDKGLSIKELYYIFNNRSKNVIKETVQNLEHLNLIKKIYNKENKFSYVLTEFGANKILEFYQK